MVGIFGLSSLQQYFLGGTSGTHGEAASTMRINGAAATRFAYKFYSPTTSPITSVNPYVVKAGTVTAQNFTVEIQSDSSDAPNAILGGASAAWTGPAASGFIGDQALTSNTGALALNTPYWIVIIYTTGGTPDTSNYITPAFPGSLAQVINTTKIRGYNGSDWTTITASNNVGSFLCTHADGTLSGIATTTAAGNSGATDIFGTNRQGIRWKTGCLESVIGARVRVTKASTPAALELVLYEGTTEKATASLAAAEVQNNIDFATILFSSAVQLQPNTSRYLILRQLADGGTDAADYDMVGNAIQSGYIAAHAPADLRYVSGTGSDPTALTVSTTFIPRMMPIYADPAAAISAPPQSLLVQGQGTY